MFVSTPRFFYFFLIISSLSAGFFTKLGVFPTFQLKTPQDRMWLGCYVKSFLRPQICLFFALVWRSAFSVSSQYNVLTLTAVHAYICLSVSPPICDVSHKMMYTWRPLKSQRWSWRGHTLTHARTNTHTHTNTLPSDAALRPLLLFFRQLSLHSYRSDRDLASEENEKIKTARDTKSSLRGRASARKGKGKNKKHQTNLFSESRE